MTGASAEAERARQEFTVAHRLFRRYEHKDTASLIEEFQYPRLGPGMMWERTAEIIDAQGGEVHLRSEVMRVNRRGNRVTSIDVKHWHEDGREPVTERVEGEHFINSMALRDLIHAFDPPAPPEVDAVTVVPPPPPPVPPMALLPAAPAVPAVGAAPSVPAAPPPPEA